MSKTQIKGLKQLTKDLKKFDIEVQKEIDVITKSNAKEIEAEAKQKAPVINGFLRNQIAIEKVEGEIAYKIVANARYSAYMEFGTGGLVEIPDELRDIAYLFKGKGIKKINIRPRPFLYPAFVNGRSTYIEDLKDLLKQEVKKI